MFNIFTSNMSVSDQTLIYNTKEFMVSIVKTLRPDIFVSWLLYFLDISLLCHHPRPSPGVWRASGDVSLVSAASTS